MIADPVVRSVRVAVALCDRFEELKKGPLVVTAAKANRSIVGVKGEDEAFSLRVNEAQQIYPEIWSHLDDARKVAAARGVNVAGFDAIRDNERQFKPTGVDIQTNYQQVSGPYGSQATTKKANFNDGGIQRARLAIQALQNATPDIDWAAIAKAEANDPNIAAFRRATIIKRIWQFGLLIAVVGIPFWYILWQRHEENVKRDKWRRQSQEYSYQPPPPAPPPANALPAPEQKALLDKANKLVAELQAATTAWESSVLAENLKKIAASDQPCALVITPPPQEAADKYIKRGDVDEKAFASSAFFGYLSSDGVVPDSELLRVLNLARRAIRDLEGGRGTPETRTTLDELDKPIVFVMIDKDDEPQVNSFKPLTIDRGKITARGYVFDPKTAKVTCAAALDIKGSDAKAAAAYLGDIEDGYQAKDILHRELEVRIRDGLAANLKAVAP